MPPLHIDTEKAVELTFSAALGFLSAASAERFRRWLDRRKEITAAVDGKPRADFAAETTAYQTLSQNMLALSQRLEAQVGRQEEQIHQRDEQIDRQEAQIDEMRREIEALREELQQTKLLNGGLVQMLIRARLLPTGWKPADGLPELLGPS